MSCPGKNSIFCPLCSKIHVNSKFIYLFTVDMYGNIEFVNNTYSCIASRSDAVDWYKGLVGDSPGTHLTT
jgi:hypothetical protein